MSGESDDTTADTASAAGATCELIDAHHPDCECATCRDGRDAICGEPAVGTARMGDASWRVCARCAASADRDPEAEGVVTYDAPRIAPDPGRGRELTTATAGVVEAAGTPTHLRASPHAVSLFNSVMDGIALELASSHAVLPGDAEAKTEALIARIRDLSKAEPPAGVVFCHGRRAPWRRSARQRSRDRRRRRGW